MLNPCPRESKARTRKFLRGKLISDQALFSSYESQQAAAYGQDLGAFFRDAQGFGRLDAGSPRAGFISSRPLPPPWSSILQFYFFLNDVTLINKSVLIEPDEWSMIVCFVSCCLERWSWVADNNPSRMERSGLMNRYEIGRHRPSKSVA